MTPLDMLLAAVGSKDDPNSGGRQMPSHWGIKALNIVSGSSATGMKALHAVGSADASVIYDRVTAIPDRDAKYHADEVVVRLGRRWDDERGRVLGIDEHGLHAAAARAVSDRRQRLRHLRSSRIPDTRRRHLAPAAIVSRICTSSPSTARTFSPASRPCATPSRTCARARDRQSSTRTSRVRTRTRYSDDETLYKTPAEREAEARRDPISEDGRRIFVANGIADGIDLAAMLAEIDAELNEAAKQALEAPKPSRRARRRSGSTRPTSIRPRRRSTRRRGPKASPTRWSRQSTARCKDEMARNPRIVVFGEDVADASRQRRAERRPRQRRRVQADARPAEGIRRRPRVQRADRRGRHRRPRDRHGRSAASSRSSKSSSSTTSGRR